MNISGNAISRLTKYKKVLNRFKVMGFKKVFSGNLADALGFTAAQIRKDFSVFGIPGNRRGGYSIDELINKINSLLGKHQTYNIIIAGAGNIGSALMKYPGFERENICIKALFDVDPDKINRDLERPVLPVEEMEEFVKKEDIKLGIIAVTEVFAQQTLDNMTSAGIKGILNFTPARLKAPENVFVNNIDIVSELEKVIYYIAVPTVQINDDDANDNF
jgi:redox-sensing transcriptional repressor